jgi:hypothetical protein
MAYQNPAFMVSHPAGAIAIADVTGTSATTSFSDASKRALIDSRQGEQASFTSTGADAGVEFDLLTTPTINRWVIPAGHTMEGWSWILFSDDNSAFSSATNRFNIGSTHLTGAPVFDASFTEVTTERYWLFQRTQDTAETFTLGEFWIGEHVEVANADVQPSFSSEWVHHLNEDVIGGRDVAVELAPPRRRFTLSLRYVDPADADFTILEEVIRLGRSTPFWYWTPDSTDTGPYLVKLSAAATRRQESSAPQSGIFYQVDLTMIEQTT